MVEVRSADTVGRCQVGRVASLRGSVHCLGRMGISDEKHHPSHIFPYHSYRTYAPDADIRSRTRRSNRMTRPRSRRPVRILLLTAAVAGSVVTGVLVAPAAQGQPAAATDLYIVQMVGAPVAAYSGTVAGFPATKPAEGRAAGCAFGRCAAVPAAAAGATAGDVGHRLGERVQRGLRVQHHVQRGGRRAHRGAGAEAAHQPDRDECVQERDRQHPDPADAEVPRPDRPEGRVEEAVRRRHEGRCRGDRRGARHRVLAGEPEFRRRSEPSQRTTR